MLLSNIRTQVAEMIIKRGCFLKDNVLQIGTGIFITITRGMLRCSFSFQPLLHSASSLLYEHNSWLPGAGNLMTTVGNSSLVHVRDSWCLQEGSDIFLSYCDISLSEGYWLKWFRQRKRSSWVISQQDGCIMQAAWCCGFRGSPLDTIS